MYALAILSVKPGCTKAILTGGVIIDIFFAVGKILGGGLNFNCDFLPAGERFAADGNALNALPLQLLPDRL